MNILAISDSHTSAASILRDGKIVSAVAEERVTRLKGDIGYPKQAIECALEAAGLAVNDIDKVVFSGKTLPGHYTVVKRDALYSVQDWVDEQHRYWKPRLLEGKQVQYHAAMSEKFEHDYAGHYQYSAFLDVDGNYDEAKGLKERARVASKHLGLPEEKIEFVSHEGSHAHYAYFASPYREDALVFTIDSMGDFSNNSVSIVRDGTIEMVAHSKESHLGHLCKNITLLLGLKPNQHEYKVMGLAPYASQPEVDKTYKVIKDIQKVEGNVFKEYKKPSDLYFSLSKAFEGHRFDGIAGALQRVVSEQIAEWVDSCVKQYGIHTVCIAGGLAQNIKACMDVVKLRSVNKFFVGPISGDGSLCMGAAYLAYAEELKKNKKDINSSIQGLQHAYLGPEYGRSRINQALEQLHHDDAYEIIEEPGTRWLAQQLVDGGIIGRFSGRMEFGQRALGNRSILANPSSAEVVQHINTKIKFRDFWMPFTPSILEEEIDEYIDNNKGVNCRFMAIAFESKEKAKVNLKGAMHPADFTVRPQAVTKREAGSYHALISEFFNLTGIPALLNTSFNLHGEPIVCTPEDAVSSFIRCEMDVLAFDHVAVKRKRR